jgi:hypothetical protein
MELHARRFPLRTTFSFILRCHLKKKSSGMIVSFESIFGISNQKKLNHVKTKIVQGFQFKVNLILKGTLKVKIVILQN